MHVFSRLPVLRVLLTLLIASMPALASATTAFAAEPRPDEIFLPTVVRLQPPAYVVVDNAAAFRPYEGSTSLYIVGEVKNNTDSNARFVKITAAAFDGTAQPVAENYAYALEDVIPPGEKSSFRVILSDVQAYTSYLLTVESSSSAAAWPLLEILNPQSAFDPLDSFIVTGSVRNQHATERKSVEIIVTMRDANGAVIGVGWSKASPATIAPGAQYPFKVEIYFWEGKPDRARMASYEVVAGGE